MLQILDIHLLSNGASIYGYLPNFLFLTLSTFLVFITYSISNLFYNDIIRDNSSNKKHNLIEILNLRFYLLIMIIAYFLLIVIVLEIWSRSIVDLSNEGFYAGLCFAIFAILTLVYIFRNNILTWYETKDKS